MFLDDTYNASPQSVMAALNLLDEMKGRKVVVQATVSAEGKVCVRGEVVAVRIPKEMVPPSSAESKR